MERSSSTRRATSNRSEGGRLNRAPAARPKDAVIVEVTGDHAELARAELEALLELTEGEALEEIAPLTFRARVPRGGADEIARRGGLLRHVGVEIAQAPTPGELDTKAVPVKGTYAVRATVLPGAADGTGSTDVEREVGGRIKGGRVNLLEPSHVFRVFVGARTHLTHEIYDRAADDFDERAVKHRPFFQPVSIHPKFARALVNLTGVHDGQRLLDPFCGTAGILIEAGLVGARPIGIDAEVRVVEGARANLEHFGILGAEVHEGRARDAKGIVGHAVEAAATDPPYGRSASTQKIGARATMEESAEGIAEALVDGGKLALCVPSMDLIEPLEQFLTRERVIPQRVHASLTRHYVVLSKRVTKAR